MMSVDSRTHTLVRFTPKISISCIFGSSAAFLHIQQIIIYYFCCWHEHWTVLPLTQNLFFTTSNDWYCLFISFASNHSMQFVLLCAMNDLQNDWQIIVTNQFWYLKYYWKSEKKKMPNRICRAPWPPASKQFCGFFININGDSKFKKLKWINVVIYAAAALPQTYIYEAIDATKKQVNLIIKFINFSK